MCEVTVHYKTRKNYVAAITFQYLDPRSYIFLIMFGIKNLSRKTVLKLWLCKYFKWEEIYMKIVVKSGNSLLVMFEEEM